LGQKLFLNSISSNFLNKNSQNYVVYITHSKVEALKLSNLFVQQGQKNFAIFCPSENMGENEFYYLPRAALNFIQSLIEQHKNLCKDSSHTTSSLNVLLCYDDIMTYILKEKNIFQTAKSHLASTNIFAEIRELCGNFTYKNLDYSVSSVMIADKNKANFEFEEEYEKNLKNIFSFTDKVVKFESNIKMLKSKDKSFKF
jgi:hypothetical protein